MIVFYFDANGIFQGSGYVEALPASGATKVTPPMFDALTQKATFDEVSQTWTVSAK